MREIVTFIFLALLISNSPQIEAQTPKPKARNPVKEAKTQEAINKNIAERCYEYYGDHPAADACIQDRCEQKYKNVKAQEQCVADAAQALFKIEMQPSK